MNVRSSVVLTGLVKRYGPTVALDGLDLHAFGGEILGVAGPNGSGKSTMVGVLAGELPLDEGVVEINGDVWSPTQGTKVAVVHQEPQVFPNLTVEENLVAGRERFVVGRPLLDAEEGALVSDFGMLDVIDRPLGALPLSFRQRVEIMPRLAAGRRCRPVRRTELGAELRGIRRTLRQHARPGQRWQGRDAGVAPAQRTRCALRSCGRDPRRANRRRADRGRPDARQDRSGTRCRHGRRGAYVDSADCERRRGPRRGRLDPPPGRLQQCRDARGGGRDRRRDGGRGCRRSRSSSVRSPSSRAPPAR